MEEPASPNCSRTTSELAPVAGVAGPREDNPERNRIAHFDGFAATRVPPNKKGGPSLDPATALGYQINSRASGRSPTPRRELPSHPDASRGSWPFRAGNR